MRNIDRNSPVILVYKNKFSNQTVFSCDTTGLKGDVVNYKIAELRAEGKSGIELLTLSEYRNREICESNATKSKISIEEIDAIQFNLAFSKNQPCRWMCGAELEIFHTNNQCNGIYDFYVRVGHISPELRYFKILAPIETTYPELKRITNQRSLMCES